MIEPLPVSREIQAEAMLNDQLPWLFAQHGLGEEALVDVPHYLTVTRSDVLSYLAGHTGTAVAYFAAHGAVQTSNPEAIHLDADGTGYIVWESLGDKRYERRFSTLNEAVAEHVLSIYGRAHT